MPRRPMTIPPVGKSGPGTSSSRLCMLTAGSSSTARSAAQISRRLCGGRLHAMPTAMPSEPLHRRFGKRLGSTIGCIRVSS